MSPTNDLDALLRMDLCVDGDDWTPTPHGNWLAQTIAKRDLVGGKDVLELGAGVANHTILMQRRGAKSIVATEITQSRLDTALVNFRANVDGEFEIEGRVADWLHTTGTFDIVVANPPFCQSGQRNRRYFIDSLVLDAHKRLRPEGELVFVQSSMADIARTLQRLDENGFDAHEVGRTEGPFRDYYFDDPAFMEEIERVEGGYDERSGVKYETLTVIHAKLRRWSAPVTAH